MFPSTAERVPAHTQPAVNDRIRREMAGSIAECAAHPERIDQRLAELEREWDIERLLEVNGSVLGLTGLFLALTGRRRWFGLSAAVFGFCLQHALKGWCPPLAVFRRMGVRTQREIDEERVALKALRGDFREVRSPFSPDGINDAARVLEAVRA